MRVVRLCIAFVFAILKSIQTAALRLAGRPVPPTFVVLMYHSVKRAEREQFARQMDCLMKLARPVQADFVNEGAKQQGSFVSVTFDDGYESVVENALPLLLDKGIPVTLFVPTKYLGSRPGWIVSEEHRDFGERLLSVQNLIRVARMKDVLIGSHSVSHRRLAKLSHGEAFSELVESRETLEGILGRKVGLFAFPYGSSSSEVLRISRKAGYDRVFLGDPLCERDNVDGHAVGRIGVSPRDWSLEYRLKLRGAYQWLPLAIAAKERVRHLLRKPSYVVMKGTQH